MQSEKHSAVGEVDFALLNMKVDLILEAIGKKDSSGTGGTGLVGDLARTQASLKQTDDRVAHLYSLKHIGVGMLVALGGTAALLYAGAKSVVIGWLR